MWASAGRQELHTRNSDRTLLKAMGHIGAPPNVVVCSTGALEATAVSEWLEGFDDHDFSLADAVSFTVMAERRIGEALTLDRHFAAAGFRTLP